MTQGQDPRLSCSGVGTERRAMCRVLARWLDLGAAGRLPSLADFDFGLDPEMGAHTFVIRLEDGKRWPLEFCGEAVAALCRTATDGRCASAILPQPLGERIPHLCKNIQLFRKPISDSGVAFAQGGEVLYRCILMPLEDGRGNLDRVLGSFTCRRQI